MDKWLVFVAVVCTAATTWAQVAPLPPTTETETHLSREQKRIELRAAVSLANQRIAQPQTLPSASPLGHQMSTQDRAEMRELLRRNHSSPKSQP